MVCGASTTDDRFDLNSPVGDDKLAPQQKIIWAPILSDIVRLKLNEVARSNVDEANATWFIEYSFEVPLVVNLWKTNAVCSDPNREWAQSKVSAHLFVKLAKVHKKLSSVVTV